MQGCLTLSRPPIEDRVWVEGSLRGVGDLRRSLGLPGNATDEESLLQAWRTRGPTFARLLHGHFALVLYDAARRRIILIRDRLGFAPLYFRRTREELAFATAVAPLLELGRTSLDLPALKEYLTLRGVHSERTLFADVRRVRPAHVAVLDVDSGRLENHEYWAIRFEPQPRSEGQLVEAFGEAFERAVGRHADAKVCYLSAGRDTSSVATTLARRFDAWPAAVTGTFDIGDRERDDVLGLLAHVGLRGVQRQMTFDEYDRTLAETVSILEGPPHDSSQPCILLAARRAAEFGDVVLGGNGGDECWGGFASHRLFTLLQAVRGNPLELRHLRHLAPDHLLRFAYFLAFGARHGNANVGQYVEFDPARIPVLRRSVRDAVAHHSPWAALADAVDGHGYSALERIYVSFFKRAELVSGQDYLLHRAAGIEIAAPYLEHDLVAFSLTVPRDQLIQRGIPKYVPRQFMRRWLPLSFLDRPKTGFPIPLVAWHRQDRHRRLRAFWREPGTDSFERIFDRRAIQRLVRRLVHVRADFLASYEIATKLHKLQQLATWFRLYDDVL